MRTTFELLIVFFLMVYTAQGQENMNSFLEIDFQDNFKNDTISLEIGCQSVFSNLVVNSEFSTGLTQLSIKFFFVEEGVKVVYGAESGFINKFRSPVELILYLNGNRIEYSIDLDKGKYIGFSKQTNKSFHFYQANEAFEYD